MDRRREPGPYNATPSGRLEHVVLDAKRLTEGRTFGTRITKTHLTRYKNCEQNGLKCSSTFFVLNKATFEAKLKTLGARTLGAYTREGTRLLLRWVKTVGTPSTEPGHEGSLMAEPMYMFGTLPMRERGGNAHEHVDNDVDPNAPANCYTAYENKYNGTHHGKLFKLPAWNELIERNIWGWFDAGDVALDAEPESCLVQWKKNRDDFGTNEIDMRLSATLEDLYAQLCVGIIRDRLETKGSFEKWCGKTFSLGMKHISTSLIVKNAAEAAAEAAKFAVAAAAEPPVAAALPQQLPQRPPDFAVCLEGKGSSIFLMWHAAERRNLDAMILVKQDMTEAPKAFQVERLVDLKHLFFPGQEAGRDYLGSRAAVLLKSAAEQDGASEFEKYISGIIYITFNCFVTDDAIHLDSRPMKTFFSYCTEFAGSTTVTMEGDEGVDATIELHTKTVHEAKVPLSQLVGDVIVPASPTLHLCMIKISCMQIIGEEDSLLPRLQLSERSLEQLLGCGITMFEFECCTIGSDQQHTMTSTAFAKSGMTTLERHFRFTQCSYDLGGKYFYEGVDVLQATAMVFDGEFSADIAMPKLAPICSAADAGKLGACNIKLKKGKIARSDEALLERITSGSVRQVEGEDLSLVKAS